MLLGSHRNPLNAQLAHFNSMDGGSEHDDSSRYFGMQGRELPAGFAVETQPGDLGASLWPETLVSAV